MTHLVNNQKYDFKFAANNFLTAVKPPTQLHTTKGSIYFVINEIFISQTFYSVTVLKNVKRCKNEVLKTQVCDLSIMIVDVLVVVVKTNEDSR